MPAAPGLAVRAAPPVYESTTARPNFEGQDDHQRTAMTI
ncbi:hypothetical protein Pd630_LPD03588 [Rhodococcus opacus PD630]|nr:hypothetical protein Pd630_LPD03588 [Rhodococcus opacus PD630]